MQLAALPGLSSSLTAPFHISTGFGPGKRDSVFPRPVQIVKWERQANIIESRRSNHKEERHYAQDRIDQAEKEAVAQNHSEQAETESTETEEDFNESTEEFTESAETEEFTESAETEEKTEEFDVEETSNAKIKIRATDATKENEVFDDVTQMFNKQIRVEDSSRANVISLEQICKRQDCQGMVECSEAPGTNISSANYEV